jgi:hypothetical protein
MLYRFFNDLGQLLYVGISARGPKRWSEHGRDRPWWHEVRSSTIEHFANRNDALQAESEAIKSERPLYNVQGAAKAKARTAKARQSPFPAEWKVPTDRTPFGDWKRVNGPRVDPMSWRGEWINSYNFKTIYARNSDGRSFMDVSRYPCQSWTKLTIDYGYFYTDASSRRYAGVDLTEIGDILSMLEAEFYGHDFLIQSPFRKGQCVPWMTFPNAVNDWFVAMILEAEIGNSAMADTTLAALKQCAPHLPDSWNDSPEAMTLAPKDRKLMARYSIYNLAKTLNRIDAESIAA